MHSHGVLRGLPEVPHEEPHEVPHEVPYGVTYGVPDGIPAGVLSVPTGSWWMLLGFDHHDMNHALGLIWTQLGPKLASISVQLGRCWPQVGSSLAQAGLMLGQFWVPSCSWANPRPSKPFPCGLLASQTPTRSKMEFKRTS